LSSLPNPRANPDPAVTGLECPNCGADVPANSAFCPACGWSMKPLHLKERAAAAIAYLPVLPPAVILLLPAFRRHRFVRFHAWQSILLWAVFIGLTVASLLLSNVTSTIVLLLFGILALLAMVFLWIVLTLKAWQGERFEVPLFGELAARLG
jgi:uncharacterized membrane protein